MAQVCSQLRGLRQQLLTFPAEHVKYVVLDEADKMLSLGLQPQLKRIRAFVIPRRSKPSEAGLGTLVKPHTRRKRPQVLLSLFSLSHHCYVSSVLVMLFAHHWYAFMRLYIWR